MIQSLSTWGKVYLGDDALLSEKEKEEKYKIGAPILKITVSPVIENKTQTLSILEIDVKMIAGVELLSNHVQAAAVVWQKQEFISTQLNPKTIAEKVSIALRDLLLLFKTDYLKANPSNTKTPPRFYLYA